MPLKAFLPMETSFVALIVIVSNILQLMKALFPIFVTFLPTVNFVRAAHFWNAPSPMVVTFAPPETVFSFVQSENAFYRRRPRKSTSGTPRRSELDKDGTMCRESVSYQTTFYPAANGMSKDG